MAVDVRAARSQRYRLISVCGPLHSIAVSNAFVPGATCLDKNRLRTPVRLYLLRRVFAAGTPTGTLDIRLRMSKGRGQDHRRSRDCESGHGHGAEYKTFHVPSIARRSSRGHSFQAIARAKLTAQVYRLSARPRSADGGLVPECARRE